MTVDYRLTPQLLNYAFEFAKLHGALYVLPQTHPWLQGLRQLSWERAALSVVATDSSLPIEELLNSTSLTQHLTAVPSELASRFQRYQQALGKLNAELPDIASFNLETIARLHESILEEPYTEEDLQLRANSKQVTKLVYANGVYREVKISVKTKPSEIAPKLAEFQTWWQQNAHTTNPLVLAGLLLAKVVEIHPYREGNGRLAQLLVHGLLAVHGLDSNYYVGFEEFFLRRRAAYYDLIERAIETQEYTAWLEFFMEGLQFAMRQNVTMLLEFSGGAINLFTQKIMELDAREIAVIDVVRTSGQASGGEIGRHLNLSRQYVHNITKNLEKRGLLERLGEKSGSRYRLKQTA